MSVLEPKWGVHAADCGHEGVDAINDNNFCFDLGLKFNQLLTNTSCYLSDTCASRKYKLLHLWQQIFKYLLMRTNFLHSISCVFSALPDKLAPTSPSLLSKN